MATNVVKEVELSFAEFTCTLISETLKAIVKSLLDQEKRIIELEQEALSSPEEYANRNLTDEDVRAEVIRLFPHSEDDKSSVDYNEPYVEDKEETPPIYEKTGYKIQRSDILRLKDKTVINKSGYENIFAATKIELAKRHLNALMAIINRGIPRVYVDKGHVSSKLKLRLEEGTPSTPSRNSNASSPKIGGIVVRRLIAQPVNVSRPEYLTLKADVLSEVEITFKTVVL